VQIGEVASRGSRGRRLLSVETVEKIGAMFETDPGGIREVPDHAKRFKS
jgi:hypothetical protein